jgi:hypothetical protein
MYTPPAENPLRLYRSLALARGRVSRESPSASPRVFLRQVWYVPIQVHTVARLWGSILSLDPRGYGEQRRIRLYDTESRLDHVVSSTCTSMSTCMCAASATSVDPRKELDGVSYSISALWFDQRTCPEPLPRFM